MTNNNNIKQIQVSIAEEFMLVAQYTQKFTHLNMDTRAKIQFNIQTILNTWI
jgi:hypothetical protein